MAIPEVCSLTQESIYLIQKLMLSFTITINHLPSDNGKESGPQMDRLPFNDKQTYRNKQLHEVTFTCAFTLSGILELACLQTVRGWVPCWYWGHMQKLKKNFRDSSYKQWLSKMCTAIVIKYMSWNQAPQKDGTVILIFSVLCHTSTVHSFRKDLLALAS